MYVCLCRGITDSQIRQAVSEGAMSVREVNLRLGTASQCGKCGIATREIVNNELASMQPPQQVEPTLFYKAS